MNGEERRKSGRIRGFSCSLSLPVPSLPLPLNDLVCVVPFLCGRANLSSGHSLFFFSRERRAPPATPSLHSLPSLRQLCLNDGFLRCRWYPRPRSTLLLSATHAHPLTLPPPPGVGSLTSLLRRLEAATTRLEDIALTQATAGGLHALPSSGASAVAGAGYAAPSAPSSTSKDAPLPPAPSAAAQAEDVPLKVQAFDELVEQSLTKYTALSKELGGLIAEQVRLPLPSPSCLPPSLY